MRTSPFVRHQLVYASCWEDSRIDRAALQIGSSDRVLVITSAGWNALAYLQDEPEHVAAVDLNHRQNALLELKIAGIRRLSFAEFFDLFGRGYSARAVSLYQDCLRDELSPAARRYWDRGVRMFAKPGRPFYFHGGVGTGAWWLRWYARKVLKLEDELEAMFSAETLQQQVQIYRTRLRPRFWSSIAARLLNSRWVLATAGVPAAQWRHACRHIPDAAAHLDDCAERVLAKHLLRDNHFWQITHASRATSYRNRQHGGVPPAMVRPTLG